MVVENEFFSEEDLNPTTLAEFEELCFSAFAQRALIDELKKNVKGEEEVLGQFENKIGAILEAHGKESFHSKSGLVYFHKTQAFRLPEGPENRALFFGHLKQKGIFEDLVTVHSKTLNTYCKKEYEAAIEDGNVTFKIPGISDPELIKDVRFRKGK